MSTWHRLLPAACVAGLTLGALLLQPAVGRAQNNLGGNNLGGNNNGGNNFLGGNNGGNNNNGGFNGNNIGNSGALGGTFLGDASQIRQRFRMPGGQIQIVPSLGPGYLGGN